MTVWVGAEGHTGREDHRCGQEAQAIGWCCYYATRTTRQRWSGLQLSRRNRSHDRRRWQLQTLGWNRTSSSPVFISCPLHSHSFPLAPPQCTPTNCGAFPIEIPPRRPQRQRRTFLLHRKGPQGLQARRPRAPPRHVRWPARVRNGPHHPAEPPHPAAGAAGAVVELWR